MSRISLAIVLSLLTTVSVCGQCGYCKSYKDFLEGNWEPLDTVYSKEQSKGHTFMWGYSNYKLTAGDKDIDRILNGMAFAVMQADSIYVNCHHLQFEKANFGNGYCKAARIGQNDLLLVNQLVGKEARDNMSKAVDGPGFMFGAVGAGIAAGVAAQKQMKNKVCYIISPSANNQGRYDIKLFDDRMMDKLLLSRELIDLHDAYYAEKDKNKRRLAARVIPILEKAGIIEAEE